MFFGKWEMSPYFATQTCWTTLPILCLQFLLFVHPYHYHSITITNHMGSWSHQLCINIVRHTIIIQTLFTNIFTV
jgi:hypothetical protein